MCQTDRFDEIAENFELFDTWEERYGYVIDLGKEMPALPDELKRSEHKVDGCRAWARMPVRAGCISRATATR